MFLTSNFIDSLHNGLLLDVNAFLPELILCGTIVLLLLMRLFRIFDRSHLGGMALLMTLAAMAVSICQWRGILVSPSQHDMHAREYEMFTGLLVYDNFTIFARIFLLGFTALVIVLSLLTGIPDCEDSADFNCLLLGATLGMMIMASANHLLMVFIGVEMASLPSYALAGFLKGNRKSSEASLKYVVYGGGASGVMLYGISLLTGKFGTGYLPNLATGFMAVLSPAPGVVSAGFDPLLLLGVFFVLIGLAFKLAAVPFHFWCPDVFEGAAAEVAGFLSVASKGAAIALLARFVLVLSGLSRFTSTPDYAAWLEVARVFIPVLAFFAAITATFGNLAAYGQTNLKRLLAYSTIAHAGYMLMGLATLTKDGAGAVLFYLVVYLFMNLGAFAIVAFIRNQTGSEDLSGYRGMIHRAPLMTILLAIFMLSLLGMPPLAGFAGKFLIFSVLFDAGKLYSAGAAPGLGTILYVLLVVGGLNTAISAVYYMKVLKVMILERQVEELEGETPEPVVVPFLSSFYALCLAVVILAVGIFWRPLVQSSDDGVDRFHKAPRPSETTNQVRS